MRIVLLRHGKPDVADFDRLSARDFRRWITAYDSAGLAEDSFPSRSTMDIAGTCVLLCSDLRRSIESANRLGGGGIIKSDALLREAGLPNANWHGPKLSSQIWAAVFRVLWFLGFSTNSESLHDAKARAVAAASRFQSVAGAKGTVLFVGHGILNRFIATELLANGWRGPRRPGRNYWDYSVYDK